MDLRTLRGFNDKCRDIIRSFIQLLYHNITIGLPLIISVIRIMTIIIKTDEIIVLLQIDIDNDGHFPNILYFVHLAI